MRKDKKYLIASIPFLIISVWGILVSQIHGSEILWITIIVSFFCYGVLFLLYSYYNHKIAKTEHFKTASLEGYRIGIIVSSILLVTGIIGALIGQIANNVLFSLIMGFLFYGSVVALIYSIVGWADIRRSGMKKGTM